MRSIFITDQSDTLIIGAAPPPFFTSHRPIPLTPLHNHRIHSPRHRDNGGPRGYACGYEEKEKNPPALDWMLPVATFCPRPKEWREDPGPPRYVGPARSGPAHLAYGPGPPRSTQAASCSCSCRARRIGVSSPRAFLRLLLRAPPPSPSAFLRERKIRSPVRRRASEPQPNRAVHPPPPPLRIWFGDNPDRTAFVTPGQCSSRTPLCGGRPPALSAVSALLRGSAGAVLDSGRGLADDGGGEAGAGVPASARGGGRAGAGAGVAGGLAGAAAPEDALAGLRAHRLARRRRRVARARQQVAEGAHQRARRHLPGQDQRAPPLRPARHHAPLSLRNARKS